MSLNVTIPDTFNGPLDLLLHLIRRDEMDIYDIPIARLAASYQEEIQKLEIINFDEGIEFLDLASTLVEIKTRMLLPPEERQDGDDDEDDAFDPRSGLVEALLEYRRFKDAARLLGEMADEQTRRFPRVAPPLDVQFSDSAEETADSLDLLSAFQGMLLRIVPREESNVIHYSEVPTSVRIEQISTVLREIGRTRFSLLLSGNPDRQEMVGFFIAMLEMIRQGRLIARQADNFTDIILEPREPAAPTQKCIEGRHGNRRAPPFLAVSAAIESPVPNRASERRTAVFPPTAPTRPATRGLSGRRTAPRFFC